MKTDQLFETNQKITRELEEQTKVKPWQFQNDSASISFSVDGVRFELTINIQGRGSDYAEGYLGLSGSAGMVPDATQFSQEVSGVILEQMKKYFEKQEGNIREVDIAIPGSMRFFDEDTQINFVEQFVRYAGNEPLLRVEPGRNFVTIKSNI